MNILKKILMGLIILIAALAVVGMLLPSAYKVERSVVINAPAEIVFDQVNDLQKTEAWSPWKDPTMKITYGPVTAGKGASSSWESKDMGSGSQTIVESVPNSSVKIFLDFKAMGTANAAYALAPEGGAVKVTQEMTGDAGMNPVKRYMNLVMDKMLGSMFEKGLAGLKSVSEAEAARIKTEAALAAAAAPADSSAVTAGTSSAGADSASAAPSSAPGKTQAP